MSALHSQLVVNEAALSGGDNILIVGGTERAFTIWCHVARRVHAQTALDPILFARINDPIDSAKWTQRVQSREGLGHVSIDGAVTVAKLEAFLSQHQTSTALSDHTAEAKYDDWVRSRKWLEYRTMVYGFRHHWSISHYEAARAHIKSVLVSEQQMLRQQEVAERNQRCRIVHFHASCFRPRVHSFQTRFHQLLVNSRTLNCRLVVRSYHLRGTRYEDFRWVIIANEMPISDSERDRLAHDFDIDGRILQAHLLSRKPILIRVQSGQSTLHYLDSKTVTDCPFTPFVV